MSNRRWTTTIVATGLGIAASNESATAQDAITRVSVRANGEQAGEESGHFLVCAPWAGCSEFFSPTAISPDGRFVAFDSSDYLDAGLHGPGVFVRDRINGSTVWIRPYDRYGSFGVWPAISDDGRFVAFSLLQFGEWGGYAGGVDLCDRDPDGNGVFDEGNETTIRVDDYGWSPSISADGRFVAFESRNESLVAGDTNGANDVFVFDRIAGQISRVSLDSNGNQGNQDSRAASISADGRIVAFVSAADNLVSNDANGVADVFLHDLATGVTIRASIDSSGVEADGASSGGFLFGWAEKPALSSDGSIVAFASYADNLAAGDTNGVEDVFVHDIATGQTEIVSLGSAGNQADSDSWAPSLSADGRIVAFTSEAKNFARVDGNGAADVFVHDRATGITTLVSGRAGITGDGQSYSPALTSDGSLVAMFSGAGNLVPDDTNSVIDAFVHDLSVTDPAATWSNYGAGYAGTLGIPSLTASANPVLGDSIGLDVGNSLGFWTVGFLIIGSSDASIVTSAGGTLLVDPAVIVPFVVWPAGYSIPADVPADIGLLGVAAYLQVIEIDPGAPYGASFTPGLQLILGQ